jgi:Spy/CpxP family protein refolding chaperone
MAGTTMAFAHGRWDNRGATGYGPEDCPGLRGGYASDLTDEQKAAITAARDKFRDDTASLRTQIRDKRDDLRDAINAETPDKEQIMEIQKELSDLESEFDQLAVQHRLEMRGLLPDDFEGRGFGKRGGRGFDRGGNWR